MFAIGKLKRLAAEAREKKKVKTFEQPSSPVQEEPEPVSCVLQGDEIQALAIKLEDLEKLHTAHLQKKEKTSITKKFLIRKSRPQEDGKKAHFLVAYPAISDEAKKTLHYSGLEGPTVDNYGYILPHSILGTLQEFKQEAIKRGHSQVARLIPDALQQSSSVPVLRKCQDKHEEEKKRAQSRSEEHTALQNWHRNMALRRKQQKRLCVYLQKSESELLMNFSEVHYRRIQEERTLIDRSLPALYPGKGYRVGSEFWSQPVYIGDEVTGLAATLGQTERGFPEEVTHVGKPRSIWMEIGTRPPKYLAFHRTWEKSLFLKHRRNELREILEKLDFYNPDLDGLEVVSRNHPYINISAESFSSSEDEAKEFVEGKSQGPLEAYPDVISGPVLGPSLKFCEQPARWINSACQVGEIGIAARVTFEILVGEKAESLLTVSNDGTAAIWYDWRRLPQPFTFQEKKRRTQNFYFNTRSGVILPQETRKFSFIFKSMNAGVFSESWEFGTHPVLLGGAVLQVTLWGIAVYEDISAGLRQELQEELEAREVAVIVEENLKDLLDRIRSSERVRSPLDAYVTEEELFHRKNQELHYQHQVVKGLHELWNKLMNPPPVIDTYDEAQRKSTTTEESSPPKSSLDSQQKGSLDLHQKSPEDSSRHKSVSPAVSAVRKSEMEDLIGQLSRADMEDMNRVEWNLSIPDFKQTLLTIPEEDEREAALAQLNKAALELCTIPLTPEADLLYQICFQLWREVIDGLVSRSLVLRSLLGMPEKDTYVEIVPEEAVEVKPVVVKGGKEDRKLQREDKKAAVKEKEKGKVAKEERPNSRKTKGKEERKVKGSTKEVVSAAVDVAEAEVQELRQEQVDPILQEKYHEKLYVEVYGLLDSMVSKMVFLFEELRKDPLGKKNKAPFV
ncbi:MYCBP-associated protein isoform X2 [Rhineura floridana]|uniref:MYCBP-associated protein isoform X2 n=1 Tax=Rhineura floridana TaxID=261503 RepID=UPI002AC7F886|nr:MYCBP-associated protein isoform X2 [Rhineura floridana]